MTDPSWNPQREAYEKTWTAPTGIRDWFATVNNQPFGQRFMALSFVLFSLAGLMALLMRVQLAVPENDVLGPDVYNQLFTMHGSTMMYLVMLPFLEGMAIYLLPLMIGSREMAFPKMSAFSFWVLFFGAMIFFSGFLFNAVPDAGWFVYPPLSAKEYSGLGLDFLLVGLGFIEIAGIGAGIEIVVTILKFRAPGMTLGRMPLFAWSWLVTAVMIIIAFSALLGATVLLELDRAAGTQFFVPSGGGNVLLWQHLFWFFGHPDVYIMFIPATGMISMIIPTFARRPIAGYKLIVIATVSMGFMSFGLWVHHMFTTGLPDLSKGFFIAASIMIALASGTQVFAWIATLWRSKPEFKTPLLYVLGFLFIFVLGGITGVMVAVLPFDLQAHDTYFVVAHFHYVLIGGVIFPVLGAIHYWMPLINGKILDEKQGKIAFWLIFIGFNLTFFPMHISGLKGMARRVYTYSESLGIGGLNMLSSVSSFVLAAGFCLMAWNLFMSSKKGKIAQKNPWNAGTLEWSSTSDMPNYVYLRPPIVTSRYPLWDTESRSGNQELERISEQLTAAPSLWRGSLVTDSIEGKPQAVQKVSGPSYLPFVAAFFFFITSVATLASSYLLALVSIVLVLAMVVKWMWPKKSELEVILKDSFRDRLDLPTMPIGTQSSGWWAMAGTLTVIGTLFGLFFYSYFYLWLYSPQWPQDGMRKPSVVAGALIYAPLIISLLPAFLTKKLMVENRIILLISTWLITALLGLLYLILALYHLNGLEFDFKKNAYASIYHVTTWHLIAGVAGGIGFLLATALRMGTYQEGIRLGYLVLMAQVTRMYWVFICAIGFITWMVLYLSPHILSGGI